MLLSGQVLATLTNGLETAWATAAVIWALVWIRERRPYWAAFAAGILPCLRPELAPVAAVLCLAAAWPLSWRGVIRTVAVAAATALPFLVWLRLDTGTWWPQTMAAKRVFFAEGCRPLLNNLDMTWWLLKTWAGNTVPIALGVLATAGVWLGRTGLAAVAAVLGAYLWALPGAIAHNEYWYLTTLLVP
ncbi:MAG: hypothetical protein FJW27_07440 [Acidimicrobiia bacterium]|nr:hypothetical protein [Acidimicrobiia bacterium]